MQTDPTRHLVKLISLVAYTEGDKCGLRVPHRTGEITLAKDESVTAHEMCMYYAGAARYVQSDGQTDRRDYDELADFTLPFVTNASPDAERLLGVILVSSLGLFDATNPVVLGRKWLDAVIDGCWSAKVAAAPYRFGFEQ